MNFDKWLRNLTEELQDKIEPEAVSKPGDTSDTGQTSPKNYDPNKVKVSWGKITIDGFSEGGTITIDDLYSHKDFARNNDNIVVSGEIGPDAQYKGMDPPFGFNVGNNWFRDQEAYEEFLELEKKVIGPGVINIKDQYTIKVSGEEIITNEKCPYKELQEDVKTWNSYGCTVTLTTIKVPIEGFGQPLFISEEPQQEKSVWEKHMETLRVGDLYRVKFGELEGQLFNLYNNGIHCQIDSIDSDSFTLAIVEVEE